VYVNQYDFTQLKIVNVMESVEIKEVFGRIELLRNELYEINTTTLRMQNEIVNLMHGTTQERFHITI
jgi:hypothetical protein